VSLYAFADGEAPVHAAFTNLLSKKKTTGPLQAGQIYRIDKHARNQKKK
jgi:hypothetical protein